MKFRFALMISGALFAILPFGSAIFAQDSGTDHEHHSAHVLDLNHKEGRKWATDESLRKGMHAIRQSFQSRLPGFREKSLEPGQYEALADEVDDQLNYMFNNCDLPPDADAELHKLLAFISGAASDLRRENKRRNGMMSLHKALDAYHEYFDHPGLTD